MVAVRSRNPSAVHRLLVRPPVVGLAGRAALYRRTEHDRLGKFVASQRLRRVCDQLVGAGIGTLSERDDRNNLLSVLR